MTMRDPNTPVPGRTFYAGRWRPPDEIERVRANKRASERTARLRDRTVPVEGRRWYAGRWRTEDEIVRVRERSRAAQARRYVPRERQTRLSPEEAARRKAERALRQAERRRAVAAGKRRVRVAKLERATVAPAKVREVWRRAKPGSIMRTKYPTMAALNASVRTVDWDRFR